MLGNRPSQAAPQDGDFDHPPKHILERMDLRGEARPAPRILIPSAETIRLQPVSLQMNFPAGPPLTCCEIERDAMSEEM